MIRCPSQSTFPAVEKFIKTNKEEDIIFLNPQNKYRQKVSCQQHNKLKSLKVRVVPLKSPDS